MAGKVIAVANMKGGVGKTTTVVSLAEALAADSRKPVLVIDTDAQANASFAILGDERLAELITKGRTLAGFLEDVVMGLAHQRGSIQDYIADEASDVTHAGQRLAISVIAASGDLRTVERELIYTLTERNFSMRAIEGQIWKALDRDLDRLRERFAYILFDCAPGISAVTEVAIRASDLVIVPTIPDYLSTLGLVAFCAALWESAGRSTALPAPKLAPHVLVTRKQNTRQHADRLADMRARSAGPAAEFRMFETVVPQAAAIPRAVESLVPNPTFRAKWGPDIVAVLDSLVAEVKGLLDGP